MKLTQVPNLRVEDFDSEKTWIGRLFIQLNPFIQSINQIFDGNVDFSSNIKSVTKAYNVNGFQPFSFTWPFPGARPIDLRVVQATKGSAQTPTILQAAWSFNNTDNLITVSDMIELTEGSVSQLSGSYQYSVRVTV